MIIADLSDRSVRSTYVSKSPRNALRMQIRRLGKKGRNDCLDRSPIRNAARSRGLFPGEIRLAENLDLTLKKHIAPVEKSDYIL